MVVPRGLWRRKWRQRQQYHTSTRFAHGGGRGATRTHSPTPARDSGVFGMTHAPQTQKSLRPPSAQTDKTTSEIGTSHFSRRFKHFSGRNHMPQIHSLLVTFSPRVCNHGHRDAASTHAVWSVPLLRPSLVRLCMHRMLIPHTTTSCVVLGHPAQSAAQALESTPGRVLWIFGRAIVKIPSFMTCVDTI